MTTLQEFNDAVSRVKKEVVVRDGKKQVVKRKEYSVPCKPGYKRDPKSGKCIRMSAEEKRNRSKATKKSARKSSTKRKRNISMRRRSSIK